MLRALGYTKQDLVKLISIKSFGFSIPATLLGILLASLLNTVVRQLIFNLTNNYASYSLTTVSICIGLHFGIVAPFLVNYFPAQVALKHELRQALDAT